MDMAGNNSPHLPMTLQNVTEGASICNWQADLIPGRDPGRDRRMVERKEGRSIRRACQLSVEPTQPVGIQFAPILARSRAVQGDEPQRPEIRRVLHRRSDRSGQVKMPSELVTVVMVSGQHIDRHAELLEQLTHKLVFPVGRVVRQITRHQYRVWSIWQAADRLDGGPQSRHRIGISPSRPDVGIAQLDK